MASLLNRRSRGEVKKKRPRFVTRISSDDEDSSAKGNGHEDDDRNSAQGVDGPSNPPLLILLSELFLAVTATFAINLQVRAILSSYS